VDTEHHEEHQHAEWVRGLCGARIDADHAPDEQISDEQEVGDHQDMAHVGEHGDIEDRCVVEDHQTGNEEQLRGDRIAQESR
jgi:hypothetical protein